MKKLLIILGLLLFPQLVEAQSTRNPCIYLNTSNNNCQSVGTSTDGTGNSPMPVGGLATTAAPTYVEGKVGSLSFDLSGNLRTSASFSPSGTQDINIAQILGAAPSLTNPLWVFPATGATFPISAATLPLPSGASTAANQTATQAPVAPATATATKSELIGAQATTSAVNPTNGQQSALSSDTNNNLLVSSGGAPTLSVQQVSVATSDTAVIGARALRRSLTVQNITGTQQVYCNATTATTANGVLLPAVVGSSITISTTSALRCIAVTSAQTIAIVETY